MFVNLHNHSAYSLLDSISKPKDMIKKAKELNQPAIALTDHGYNFAAIETYKLCQKENIKFIYGCEFYICDDIQIKNKDNKYYHLIILASTEQGRINLNKLASIADIKGKYYKPRIDFNLLQKYKDGLIILSACMAGEIQKTLQQNEYQQAKEIALKYKQEFGNNYYLEFQSHSDEGQLSLARKIVDLAKELKINWVVTSDSHYINKEDQELHSIFVQIGQEREVGETYNDCYIQSEENVRQILSPILTNEEINTAINTTIKIANKCNVQIPLSPPLIPHVEVPTKFKNEEEYLKYLCNEGWKQKKINKLSKEKQSEYKERLFYEFNAIKEMDFIGYYLLVYSYANIAKRRGIGRGSGGGSLIAYLINIVDTDPIEYGLYFERFIDVSALDLLKSGQINPEELKVPDFDLDFGEIDREKVLRFIIDQYGEDRVASIGNFQYIWDKSAIKDIGRVLGISFEITNQITKELGDKNIDELNESWFNEYPKLFHYAKQLTGLPRSFSTHPCGKIVALRELDYYAPIASKDGNIVYQADMHSIEDLGLVKIDTLGLRTVDVIYDVLEMIGEDYKYINPKNLNFKDKKVLELFKNGYTEGVFQFESPGMKQTLQKMNINSLDDLIVANALYRPGAKDFIDDYCNRKNGNQKLEYIHPDLESILSNTYGVIAYQEQLIEIGRLAKMRNPDLLRKATGKKLPELMAKVEPELKEGLKNRNWTEKQINELWEIMLKFAMYSFNKSHAVAYAITAYIVGFLKVYHPKEFICALLNSYEGKHDKIKGCYEEAKKLGINIEKLSLNNLNSHCTIQNGKVYYGIALIKYCNKQIANELNQLNKKYDSFLDLLIDIKEKTTINTRQLNALIKLNTFSNFGQNKKLLQFINFFDTFYDAKQISKTKIDKFELQYELFESFAQLSGSGKTYLDFQSYKFLQHIWQQLKDQSLPIQEQIQAEIEYLGYAVSQYNQLQDDDYIIINLDTEYSPKLQVYNLATGVEESYKIQKKIYKQNKFKQWDIIKIIQWEQKPKVRKIDDGFEEIPGEYQKWIQSYYIVS